MNKNLKRIKNNALVIFISFLLVLSIPTLLVNNIFYFSDFNEKIIVNLSSENEISEDFFRNFQTSVGVTRIDRQNEKIYFQNIGFEEVQNSIEEYITDTEIDYTISEIIPERSQQDVLLSVISAVSLFFISINLGNIYFIFRSSKIEGGYFALLKVLALNLFLIFLSVISQLTLISVVSRFYQVRDIDILTIANAGIWSSILFSLSWLQTRRNAKHTINNVIENLRDNSDLIKNYLMIAIFFIIFPLFFGMGVNFVIPGIFIASSLLLIVPSIQFILRVQLKFFSNKNKKIQTEDRDKNTIKENKASSETNNQPWKKFNKRRKKT